MNGWMRVPDGWRRPGMTCDGKRFCHGTGDRTRHSHYAWAADELWAALGDFLNDPNKCKH